MSLDDVVEECQTASLASQRTFAYACKVRVSVKFHAVEHSHYAQILHVAILHDGVEYDFAVGGDVLQAVPRYLLQILRYRENGSCRQPTAHVIARDMIEHRVVWNLEDVVLQFLQRVYAHYLGLGLGVAEYEVAESHVLLHDCTQVDRHLLRVLVDKTEALCLCLFAIGTLRTFHYQRQIRVVLVYIAQQFESSLAVLNAVNGESHVADDAQYVVRILGVESHCLLIVARKHHFGASAHSKCGGMAVERLGREAFALSQDVIIEVGKYGAVEAYAVLHKQQHLHIALLNVVVEVHFVLNEFYNRQYQVGISKPAEHVVEYRQVLVLHSFRDAVREWRQHHAMNLGKTSLDVARHRECVVVGIARHTYHKVDIHGAQHLIGFLRRAHLRERRRIAQSQLNVFVVYFLLNTSVVFKHEGVVGIGYDEHVVYASHHKIHERHVFQDKLAVFLRYHRFSFLLCLF